jgi:hypothetical protein
MWHVNIFFFFFPVRQFSVTGTEFHEIFVLLIINLLFKIPNPTVHTYTASAFTPVHCFNPKKKYFQNFLS